MKTKIIISKEWKIIKEYDFLITMTKEDVVEFEDIEYRVNCCVLEIENNTMCILLDS
tara:strand:+ start:636 stop:806 length:171 start_codon:yes stop_codon:yes gene_type:complete